MKKITLSLMALLSVILLFAQTPQSFKYQAVARDNTGNILNNQLISFRISIIQGSSTGLLTYRETHPITTNDFGIANLDIGTGSVMNGNFTTINWSSGPYYLKVEIDPSGSSSYQWMGTSQLLSVPYAQFSENTANTDDADADPTNELNIDINLNGNSLEVTDDGGTLAVDLGTLSGDSDWVISGVDLYSGVSGNVGIGTTTPDAPLEVSGRISQINTGNSVFLGYNAGLNDNLSTNLNVFIGHEAGETNTSGWRNTAIGNASLYSNTWGYSNTAIGDLSLHDNETGFENTAVGHQSLHDLTTGKRNSAIGLYAQKGNISGENNTSIGYETIRFNETGDNNTAVGYLAGFGVNGQSYSGCVFLGYHAGRNNTSDNKLFIENSDSDSPLIYGEFDNDILAVNGRLGIGTMTPGAVLDVAGHISITNTGNSVFIGEGAGVSDDLISNNNTAIGTNALFTNVSGTGNTAVGVSSLEDNTGVNNSALGRSSLRDNTSGGYNVAIGAQALQSMVTGSENVGIGNSVNFNSESGNNNTMIGSGAGFSSYSVNGCVFIGHDAGRTEESDNTLVIENSNSESPLIYGEFDNDILAINGKLGIGTHSPGVKLHIIGGTDASLAGGGYVVTGNTTAENVVIDENEIMARNNGGTSSLQLQRDGGSLSVHYGLGEINEFRIRDDGKTGIGVSFPNSKLHINTLTGENGFRVQINSATKFLVHSNGGVVAGHNVTTPTFAFQLLNSSIDLQGRGRAYSWNTYSDSRLKSNQRSIEYGLKEILQLQPKSYDHHSSSTNEEGEFIMATNQKEATVGFIAQEVQQIIPEAVCKPQDDSKDLWSMDYDKLIPVLTMAIQEQQEIIEEQQVMMEELLFKIERLENK